MDQEELKNSKFIIKELKDLTEGKVHHRNLSNFRTNRNSEVLPLLPIKTKFSRFTSHMKSIGDNKPSKKEIESFNHKSNIIFNKTSTTEMFK